MNITLDINCPELAEAINNLAAAMSIRVVDGALATGPRPAEEKPFLGPVKAASPEKPARSAKSKADTPPTPEPETAGGEDAPATETEEPATSSSADAPDYEEVRAAVVGLSAKKGRDPTVALLTKFGVPAGQKADAIDPSRWADFIAEANELAAG